MKEKSISLNNIFLYDPKKILFDERRFSIDSKNKEYYTKYNEFNSSFFSTGNSTFDYFNSTNKNKNNILKAKESFLTHKLRNDHVLNNIQMKTIYNNKNINPLYKLSLSKSSELFTKLISANKKYKNEHMSSSIDYNLLNKNNKIPPITNFNNNIIKNTLNNVKLNEKINEENSIKEINFLYHKIFPKFFIAHNIKYNVVDNKLNIYYAENEEIFKENLNKKNIYLSKKGKPIKKMLTNTTYVKDKLKEVKKKISFLKGVVDYSFPSIILEKVKQKNYIYQMNKKKNVKFQLPYEEIGEEVKMLNKCQQDELSSAIKIENNSKK